MRLTAVNATVSGDTVRLTGVVSHAGGETKETWFEYPAAFAEFVRADADVFLPLLLIAAMKTGEELATDLPVSRELALGLAEWQDIYVTWFPSRVTRVKLAFTNVVRREPPSANRALSFFSAGVDSLYTALGGGAGRSALMPPITHLVFMDGAEQPLSVMKESRANLMKEAADALGLELIAGRTNVRDVYPYDYGLLMNGPVLASIGLSLSNGFSWAAIPASGSYRYEDTAPWGSHPFTDGIFSTEYLRIRHDSADMTRMDKVARIAESSVALKYLCSCTKNLARLHNCGRCPKCVRTMIMLHAAGKLESASTFTSPLDYSLVRRVDLYNPVESAHLAHVLDFARTRDVDPRLVRAIEKHLRRHEKFRAIVALIKGTPLEWLARLFVGGFVHRRRFR
jgi:hypothetical protein